MTSITQLPKAVHSTLRSSVVLFDLPRIVEELIYNSIDAGAAKVNVSISVGECYVKVDDDGCGITRDGMGLLGEKYATSKLHCLAEMDVASGNFGFRGETLGSLSDVSLLEVTTKARGKPNGYRKIIKGCKCLYLGLDDNRQEMGTTVVVRDLFYNQPVRRKCMHSSPKKVLHSVRECVLRVALVHPQVSFRVADVQSGDVVFCTHHSPSPLPLVSSGFGVDVSRSLCNLNFSKCNLKLSGYISAPMGTCSMKALQYVYINSRFVCKGPIHKLLNSLADRSKCLSGFENVKSSRTQAYPLYILNLCCPRSNYDVTFEPSKTVVEFKDWMPVLSFIEEAVKQFWRKMPAKGDPEVEVVKLSGEGVTSKNDDETWSPRQDVSAANISVEQEVARTERSLPNVQNIQRVASGGSDFLLHPHKRMPSETIFRNRKRSKHQETVDNFYQTDYTSQDMSCTSWDAFSFRTTPVVDQEHCIERWPPDNDSLDAENNILSKELAGIQTSKDDVNDDILGSIWDNDFLEVDITSKERSTERLSSSYYDKHDSPFIPRCFKGLNKPFVRACSLSGNKSSVRNANTDHGGLEVESDDICCRLRKHQSSDDIIYAVDADNSNRNLNLSPETSLSDIFATSSHSSSSLMTLHSGRDLVTKSPNLLNRHHTDKGTSAEDGDFLNNSSDQFGGRHCGYMSESSAQGSASPYSLFRTVSPEVDSDDYAPHKSGKIAISSIFGDRGMKDEFLNCVIMHKYSTIEDPASRCTEIDSDYEYAGKYLCESAIRRRRSYSSLINAVGCDKSTGETDWMFDNSSVQYDANYCATPDMHINLPCYQEINYPVVDIDIPFRRLSSFPERRSRRSHSAPPFYKGKGKFSTIYNLTNSKADRGPDSPYLQETGGFKFSSASCGVAQHQVEPSPSKDSHHQSRASIKSMQHNTEYIDQIEEATGDLKHLSQLFCESRHQYEQCSLEGSHQSLRTPIKMMHYDTECTDQIQQDFTSSQTEGMAHFGVKWRNGNNQNVVGHDSFISDNLVGKCPVLDIFSGFMHLAGGSVVPESISRDCLENANVLLQLDKKFIPVVAGGTLVVIDQHAADERIRLEELRNKILSGEGKSVAYLDSEQELVLPEVGYQLLQNYAEQVQKWGWICNDHAQGLESFTKNINLLHRRTSVITLRAVPCILGVKLSDRDLLEFLEQLYETDGSSTLPPAVNRVLNFKACRGAIMFGDALLPSECSLIIEELKQTSLCFQCAHGRPTTVPLVNLEALHKQISNLNNLSGGLNEPWHGLHQHKLSLERARQRLISAGG